MKTGYKDNSRKPIEHYLVGGAVRDNLLGLPVKDRDWVVVNATAADLLDQGYRQVGKDFPVFIHPTTGEEHALARTERKTAAGYHGFEVDASPDVTLKEDLWRRDLTINAMAEDDHGRLIDCCGGKSDLDNRLLRHISPAFVEDPVRVLRVARFAARFADRGFTVADETMALMSRMVENGEVDALVAERVWQETALALSTKTPERFFEVLRECGALTVLFPEIDRLFGIPQPARYHPEIDTGIHTLMVLRRAAELSDEPVVRFAALTHDLGKGTTPKDEWPSHRGHEERGVQLVDELCGRYKVPNEFRELAEITAREHLRVHRALELTAKTLVALFEGTDAFRKPQRFQQLLIACQADAQGRAGLERQPYPQAAFLAAMLTVCNDVDIRRLVDQGHQGDAMREQLRRARIAAVDKCRSSYVDALAAH